MTRFLQNSDTLWPRVLFRFVSNSYTFSTLSTLSTLSIQFVSMFSFSFLQLCDLQGNDQIRWCSSPDCEYLIRKALTLPLLSYACQCGEVYCFECGDPAHEIITCKQLEAFKNHTEGASYKWIIKNAKGCPKCSASIQKNGGCMHMVHRIIFHYCWICSRTQNRFSHNLLDLHVSTC